MKRAKIVFMYIDGIPQYLIQNRPPKWTQERKTIDYINQQCTTKEDRLDQITIELYDPVPSAAQTVLNGIVAHESVNRKRWLSRFL